MLTRALGLLLLLGCSSPHPSGDPVSDLLILLRSDEPGDQQRAETELTRLGRRATPGLQKAVSDHDVAFADRARKILDLISLEAAHAEYERVQSVLLGASTLSAKFTTKAVWGTRGNGTAAGSMLLKRGNKLLMSGERYYGDKTGKRERYQLVSDGNQLQGKHDTRADVQTAPTPEDLSSRVVRGILQWGPITVVTTLWKEFSSTGSGGADKSAFELGGFSVTEESPASRCLSFTLKCSAPVTSGTIRIWFVPDSCRLLKREWIGDFQGEHSEVTTAFHEFELNGDIPDGYFIVR